MKNIKVVIVRWEDATHQKDETEPLGTMEAHTVGFLLRKTKKDVVVCMEFFEDGSRRNITNIPRGMVKEIKEIASIPFKWIEAGQSTETKKPE